MPSQTTIPWKYFIRIPIRLQDRYLDTTSIPILKNSKKIKIKSNSNFIKRSMGSEKSYIFMMQRLFCNYFFKMCFLLKFKIWLLLLHWACNSQVKYFTWSFSNITNLQVHGRAPLERFGNLMPHYYGYRLQKDVGLLLGKLYLKIVKHEDFKMYLNFLKETKLFSCWWSHCDFWWQS